MLDSIFSRFIVLENRTLILNNDDNRENIDVFSLLPNRFNTSEVLKLENIQFKIITWMPLPEDLNEEYIKYHKSKNEEPRYILVYKAKEQVRYGICTEKQACKRLVRFRHRMQRVHIGRNTIKIKLFADIVNAYGLDIGTATLYIDNECGKECHLNVKCRADKLFRLSNQHTLEFDTKEFLEDESGFNSAIKLRLMINGNECTYLLDNPYKEPANFRLAYAPFNVNRVSDSVIYMRRNRLGRFILTKRKLEPIEYDGKYKFWNSFAISGAMYLVGKIIRKIRKTPVNLFYEKLSEKAEEGTFELFEMCRDNSRISKNYFIIDSNSGDYERISSHNNVVAKYSPKYYWLLYTSNNAISTESPGHLVVMRSASRFLKRSVLQLKFIFLQHGITYMKNQGKRSAFVKGCEAEADLMVVSGHKEMNVCAESLQYGEDQFIITGMPSFSLIEHDHINNRSDDIATIMLTWKPYEEHLEDLNDSHSVKAVKQAYEVLSKYIKPENIRVAAHPKVTEQLMHSEIGDKFWTGTLKDLMAETKLLVTDYSSIAYNAFYQGAGVIFYQSDLEEYENFNGKMIPTDDEYIGYRAFNSDELANVIGRVVKDGKINLDALRTTEFVSNYKEINEFSDGKNAERVFDELKQRCIV